MKKFKRRGGVISSHLSEYEVSLLTNLVDQLIGMVAEAWMRSFTDLRLALATRLGVEEGDEELWHALPDDDPRAQAHDIYEWVGYLQESLVLAMTE